MNKPSRARRAKPAPQDESVESTAPAACPRPTLRNLALGVLAPFLGSRLVLGLIAWCTWFQPRAPSWVPEYAQRGWGYSPLVWLDVWVRWDSQWYLDIAMNGYKAGGYVIGKYSNIAFFPVFPGTMRLLSLLMPESWRTPTGFVALGVVLANLCALGALTLLYWHVHDRFRDHDKAARAVLALLAFPTAFFLSCLYTESTFLLLAVACYHLAWKQRWLAACLVGALLSATRSAGVLILLPLVWMQLQAVDFQPRRLGRRALYLALVPLGLLAYLFFLWHLTGDPLAITKVQTAWHRSFSSPLALFGTPPSVYGDIFRLDQALTLVFIALAVGLAVRRFWRVDALLVLSCLVPFLFTGTPHSACRYVLVAFPAYIWLANLRSESVRHAYLVAASMGQAALWALWVQMRWVA